MDYFQQNERIKKQKTEQSIHFFFTAFSIGVWAFYYNTCDFNVTLFTTYFLPYFSIGQIAFGCLVIFIYLFTKSRPRYIKLYIFLSVVSLILILLGFIVILTLWIMHSDLFQGDDHSANYLLCSAQLVQLFTYFLTSTTQKTLKLILQMEFFEQYVHLLIQHNLLDGGAHHQPEQKNIRVNSMYHSQMNMVFGNQCTICNEETDVEQKAVQLECMHIFHSECIRKWLENSKICPNCRREVEEQS